MLMYGLSRSSLVKDADAWPATYGQPEKAIFAQFPTPHRIRAASRRSIHLKRCHFSSFRTAGVYRDSPLKTILFIPQMTLLRLRSCGMKYAGHSGCFKSQFLFSGMALMPSGPALADNWQARCAVYQRRFELHNIVIY